MKPTKPLNANQSNEAELKQLYDLYALWTPDGADRLGTYPVRLWFIWSIELTTS